MNTRRLYHSSKRRREVYLKKMSFLAATFVLVLCFSIIAGSRLADAHDDSQSSTDVQKYFKSIEIQSGDTLWDIASEYTNGDQQSIRGYVGELMKINNLATDQIQEDSILRLSTTETKSLPAVVICSLE